MILLNENICNLLCAEFSLEFLQSIDLIEKNKHSNNNWNG